MILGDVDSASIRRWLLAHVGPEAVAFALTILVAIFMFFVAPLR